MKYIFHCIISINLLLANVNADETTNNLIVEGQKAINEQRFSEAKSLFKNACDLKNYDGCYFLAALYDGVSGSEQNSKLANQYYQKSCDGSDNDISGYACYSLGLAYDTGNGIKKNHSKAIESFSKACKYGDATSCFNLGSIYYKGTGIKKDLPKAYYFLKKSCDLGNEDGCNNEKFILHNL